MAPNEEKDEELRTRVLDQARDKFLREGFTSTSMDDIAGDLRMSKKTIYRLFPSKEDILERVIDRIMNFMYEKRLRPVFESGLDPIAKIVVLLRTVAQITKLVSPRVLREISTGMPRLFARIDEFRRQKMLKHFPVIIADGIRGGYFIDRPPELMAGIAINCIRSVTNPEFALAHGIRFSELLPLVVEMVIGGLLTDKGRAHFAELKTLDAPHDEFDAAIAKEVP